MTRKINVKWCPKKNKTGFSLNRLGHIKANDTNPIASINLCQYGKIKWWNNLMLFQWDEMCNPIIENINLENNFGEKNVMLFSDLNVWIHFTIHMVLREKFNHSYYPQRHWRYISSRLKDWLDMEKLRYNCVIYFKIPLN